MKIQLQIYGIFNRIQLNGADSIPVSLGEFITEIQAIATENYRRTPELLRQSFGLNFIPESVLINLCKQAHGVNRESELYQIKSLRLFHPIASQLDIDNIEIYNYQFTANSPKVNFQLTPDDPQIPIWNHNINEQTGSYTITLENPHYPDLDDNIAHRIWEYSQQYWQNLPNIEKINFALQSLDINNFRIVHSHTPNLILLISSRDLSFELKTAISFLRWGESDISDLPETARLLVEEYQSRYNCKPVNLPANLSINHDLSPQSGFFIQRKNNRDVLQKIIQQANQFLLISSYIIEDENLTELICQKSSQLPQGVWILTDFRDEILDRLDEQVNILSSREQYQRSNKKKKACLIKLLNANVNIRSGAFHLKTYISEKYAYLGSCNLTGGSLDFNMEAGVVFGHQSTHQFLIQLFRHFWEKCSQGEIIPDNNYHPQFRSLLSSHHIPYANHPNLLTPKQYKADIIRELSYFQDEVIIYSRSFYATPEIAAHLQRLKTSIFIDSQMSFIQPNFTIHKINNLHAKITILGNKVAYIGGINFNFSPGALSLHDLMYKTTNANEINQIYSKLNP
jgi:phosphatidylserine/phosphatidylglycerophosphate/cardiolipin synthase-like enzyme